MIQDTGAQHMVEAKGRTLTDHLIEYLARPPVVERMKPWQTAFDGLLKAFGGLCKLTGALIQRAASRRWRNPVPREARPCSGSDPSQGQGSACSLGGDVDHRNDF
jgi:hypothetical protein